MGFVVDDIKASLDASYGVGAVTDNWYKYWVDQGFPDGEAGTLERAHYVANGALGSTLTDQRADFWLRLGAMPSALRTAEAFWDARLTAGQVLPNRGSIGSAINGQLGSTAGADANDPTLTTLSNFPAYSFTTDDYIEVPDNANLDFAAADSFTVLVVVRQPAVSTAQTILRKRGASGAGYEIRSTAGGAIEFSITDGTATATASRTAVAGQLNAIWGVRSVGGDTVSCQLNGGAAGSVTDTTTATLANAITLRVGADHAGLVPLTGEVLGFAVWRRALSAGDITAVNSYWNL